MGAGGSGRVGVAVAAIVALVALSLAGVWVRRWANTIPDEPVSPNASIDRGAGHEALRFAIVHFDDERRPTLVLSAKPIGCEDYRDPEPGGDDATIDLPTPIADAPVTVDFGGHRETCVEPPTPAPPAPPPTSKLHVESLTFETLRGTIVLDEDFWRPSRKGPYCDGSSYHESGGGPFEAKICRTRWESLFGR